LLYCVNGLWRMKVFPALEEVAIWVWLRIHNPSWFGSNVPNDPLPPHVHTTLANLPKSQFFQYFSEAWSGDAEFRRLFADILAKRVA
jgi:hypothetical protein